MAMNGAQSIQNTYVDVSSHCEVVWSICILDGSTLVRDIFKTSWTTLGCSVDGCSHPYHEEEP